MRAPSSGYRKIMEELDVELVRDHLAGVELELVDAVEQQHRAEIQGRTNDAAQLQVTIDTLHAELVLTADVVAAQITGGAAS